MTLYSISVIIAYVTNHMELLYVNANQVINNYSRTAMYYSILLISSLLIYVEIFRYIANLIYLL
jgi:hypothetical protein